MRLKGKVAAWFYGIIIFVAVVEVPLLIVSTWIEPNLLGAAISLLVLICVESLCLSIAIRNYVEFQAEGLFVVFGFIKKSIMSTDFRSSIALKRPICRFERCDAKGKSAHLLNGGIFSAESSCAPTFGLPLPNETFTLH